MFYHFTNAFQSESTLFSYLNVKELFTRNRRDIWSLSDSNGIRTHNHLVRKRTLNHLAKRPVWLNGWVFVYELSRCGFESRYCHISFCVHIIWKHYRASDLSSGDIKYNLNDRCCFHRIVWCFQCWLWTSKYQVGMFLVFSVIASCRLEGAWQQPVLMLPNVLEQYLHETLFCNFISNVTSPLLCRSWIIDYWMLWARIYHNEIKQTSHPEVFLRKGVPKICSKFTGEDPYRSVISIKLQSNSHFSMRVLLKVCRIFSE